MVHNLYERFLSGRSIAFEHTSAGMAFDYRGHRFILSYEQGNELYIKIVMPDICNLPRQIERDRILNAMNNVNCRIEQVKGIMLPDNSVWLGTERHIGNTPNPEKYFFRLLDLLHTTRTIFLQEFTF